MKKIQIAVLAFVIGFFAFGLSKTAYAGLTSVRQAPFQKGWNLVFGFMDPSYFLETSSLKFDNIKAIYALIPGRQEYARVFPDMEAEKLNSVDQAQLANAAFWVYSDESADGKLRGVYNAAEYYMKTDFVPFDKRDILPGWNFIGITTDMYRGNYNTETGQGDGYFSLGEIKGDCDFAQIYWWNSALRSWEKIGLDKKITSNFGNMLGTGLAVKVYGSCRLGVVENSLPITPPALPTTKVVPEIKLIYNTSIKFTPVGPFDHILGSNDASVIMIEYSDLQCPFCKSFDPILRKLVDSYGGKVRFVYRHNPISYLHSNAIRFAYASECAASQGKFWEMIDVIFKSQNDGVAESTLRNHAETIGINPDKLMNCLNAEEQTTKVVQDMADAKKYNIQGTPYLLIVGPKGQTLEFNGLQSFETLSASIKKML